MSTSRYSSPTMQRFVQPGSTRSSHVNVGPLQRLGSVLAGGALMMGGLTHRSAAGYFATAVGGALVARGATGHCPVLNQMGMDMAHDGPQPVEIVESVTLLHPRDDVYAFWRTLENLPQFMRHLESVVDLGEGRSRWTAAGPGPIPDVVWEARIVDEIPGELLVWESVDDAAVDNAGHVRFVDAPGGGTEVHVRIAYRPPGGELGKKVAEWLDPALSHMVREDIWRFKDLLETGERRTTEGQPADAGGS